MFIAKEIINGDEIIVSPNWAWEGREGNQVVVWGYTTPQHGMVGYEFAKKKLEALIKGKTIHLYGPKFVHRYGDNKLVCHVYLDGVDIANYFPEFLNKSWLPFR